ncbi:MAG TPA: phosphate ABC transporter substrate-binding protein PstS [Stellaceae bacterium]|jgi:phosphate transport system substrate-binding protein|nr:phosphate ABC transporter substrate-binding protein PstS [Stellaceae bacterium]
MTDKFRRALVGAALIFALAVPPAHAAGVTLNESGSTLLFPVFQTWIAGYKSVAPDVEITAAGTGSGAGTKAAIAGEVRIGTSDAYLSDRDAAQNPQILDIPLAISAQTINYNLPGLNNANLKIDGPTLAAIYAGKVMQWDDPAITAMNPGAQLPHQPIVPVRRADGSGDTFIFTQFLDFSAESWEDNPGYGIEISWPKVDGEKAATGNEGVVQTLATTPYSIGYIGISYGDQIAKAALGTAQVKNQAGKFLLPTPQTIADGAAELDPRTPPYERITLVFAPGDNSYPLVNYEYAVVSKAQPNAATADALRHFLLWAVSETGGNSPSYLQAVGFIALPDFIRALSEKQIAQIQTAVGQ